MSIFLTPCLLHPTSHPVFVPTPHLLIRLILSSPCFLNPHPTSHSLHPVFVPSSLPSHPSYTLSPSPYISPSSPCFRSITLICPLCLSPCLLLPILSYSLPLSPYFPIPLTPCLSPCLFHSACHPASLTLPCLFHPIAFYLPPFTLPLSLSPCLP